MMQDPEAYATFAEDMADEDQHCQTCHGNAWGIAAGSTNWALGAWVEVEGLGTFRIADRGRLGARHVDVLVPTTAEAVQLGRQTRVVCEVVP